MSSSVDTNKLNHSTELYQTEDDSNFFTDIVSTFDDDEIDLEAVMKYTEEDLPTLLRKQFLISLAI